MTDIDNNKEEILSETLGEILGDNEFVFTEQTDEDGNKQIMGGGYKVKSFFLQGGIPAFTQIKSSDKGQDGGKVSSPFDNLAVPAGIFYINQRIPKKDRDTNDINNYYKKHEMVSDDMIDKLFGLVEADKKRKRKTRRHVSKPDKRKTRRNA
jgi:hypothetical protein